tara:strand:- start:431 stop:967 length:537 start_codon:yes stop_codon:yes gene_type:complete
MEIKKVKISQIKQNEDNPRFIKDYKFGQLVKSIREFPEMLQIRPIVVNNKNIILGGNMRYKASVEVGLEHVYVVKIDDLTEQQQREFIIKDNIGFGEWDWDILANHWDVSELSDWGLDAVKHDWDDLDYIEEEVENKNFEEDNQIVVILNELDIPNKRKIKDDLAAWLEQNYKGSEIK